MTVLLDPAPFYVRASKYSDSLIVSRIGQVGVDAARYQLIRLGWPLPAVGSTTLVLDAVQAFQEMWCLSDDRLTVDRWPGKITLAAMQFSIERDGKISTNFRAPEFRDRHNDGWIYMRHEQVRATQLVRTTVGHACWLHSATSTVRTNRLRGSTSHPNLPAGIPGSRHIWGEASDIDKSNRMTVGQARDLGVFSGIGHTRSGPTVAIEDEHLMHGDIGGLLADGSNKHQRAGGVENPTLWGYPVARLT